jgi:hypothetical protein
VINQIRGFLIERGITVRQGGVPLRKLLPEILSSNTDLLLPRIVSLVADLAQDWRRLDERIAAVSAEIEVLAQQDNSSQRLMSVPGIGPIRAPWWRRSAMALALSKDATSAPDWNWCPSSSRRAIARSWERSPNAVIPT